MKKSYISSMKKLIYALSLLLIIYGTRNLMAFSDIDTFERSYYENYQVLMCSHNMSALIDALDKNGQLGDAQIVHVRALSAPFVEVNAYESRNGPQKWSFHAFMVKDELVYDTDFQDVPKVIAVKKYLQKMFFPDHKKRQKLLYQIKPAYLYGPEDFDGTMDKNLYPLQELFNYSF